MQFPMLQLKVLPEDLVIAIALDDLSAEMVESITPPGGYTDFA